MSLVVLRSWSDGPPKVRAIAPPDSGDSIEYVPDHNGQFVAQKGPERPRTNRLSLIQGRRSSVKNGDDLGEEVPLGFRSRSKSHNSLLAVGLSPRDNVMTTSLSVVRKAPGGGANLKTCSSSSDLVNLDPLARNHDRGESGEKNLKEHQEHHQPPHDNDSRNPVNQQDKNESNDPKNNHNSPTLIHHSPATRKSNPRYASSPNISQYFNHRLSTVVLPGDGEKYFKNPHRPLSLASSPLVVKAIVSPQCYVGSVSQGDSDNSKKVKPDTLHLQPRSVSASPEQGSGGEIDSTPPSSPQTCGRYRNLGPELAACIPRRQLKHSFNWMRDDPNNIGIKWSERRSLSTSTPSLSQDFYSSEEEKISSFSSQSSSATPSPQPPSSTFSLMASSSSTTSFLYTKFPSRPDDSTIERIIEETLPESPHKPSASSSTSPSSSLRLTLVRSPELSSPSPSLDSGCGYSPRLQKQRRSRPRQLVQSPSSPPPPPPPPVFRTGSRSNSGSSTVSSVSSVSSNETDTTAVPESSKEDNAPPTLGHLSVFPLFNSAHPTSNSEVHLLNLPHQVSKDIQKPHLDLNSSSEEDEIVPRIKSDVVLVEVIRKTLKTTSSNASSSRESVSSSASLSCPDSQSDCETNPENFIIRPPSSSSSLSRGCASALAKRNRNAATFKSSSSDSGSDIDSGSRKNSSSKTPTKANAPSVSTPVAKQDIHSPSSPKPEDPKAARPQETQPHEAEEVATILPTTKPHHIVTIENCAKISPQTITPFPNQVQPPPPPPSPHQTQLTSNNHNSRESQIQIQPDPQESLQDLRLPEALAEALAEALREPTSAPTTQGLRSSQSPSPSSLSDANSKKLQQHPNHPQLEHQPGDSLPHSPPDLHPDNPELPVLSPSQRHSPPVQLIKTEAPPVITPQQFHSHPSKNNSLLQSPPSPQPEHPPSSPRSSISPSLPLTQPQQVLQNDSSSNNTAQDSDRLATEKAIAESILSPVLAQAEQRVGEIFQKFPQNSQTVPPHQPNTEQDNPDTMDRGKYFYEGASPVASLKIPVEAINKHVRSDSVDEFETMDVITWQKRSSVRDSFRGFCQDLLESSSSQASSTEDGLSHVGTPKGRALNEKVIIHVPLQKDAGGGNNALRNGQRPVQQENNNKNQIHPEPRNNTKEATMIRTTNEGVIEFDEDEEDDDGSVSELSSMDHPDASHPIQQCNNSIEYISVLDNVQVTGKVKNGSVASLEPVILLPRQIKWIVSLDLGSRTSGFSYWHFNDPNMVHIGSWSSEENNCFHKVPSWILMNLDSENEEDPETLKISNIKIGQDALDDYTENRGKQSSTFVSQWREFFQLDSEAARLLTFPYTLESLEDKMDFSHLIKSLVSFFGKAALSQIQAKFPSSLEKGESIEWVITTPTSWNTESRQCIREAAYKSGAVRPQDGVNLVEDPMAASFFASMCGNYDNFLSVDVGGAFVHICGFERIHGRFHQAFEARSLSLPTPESAFESRLTQIVGREYILYYKAKYRPGWIELLKNFERAKCKFDISCCMSHSSAFVFLPSSFVTEFYSYTGIKLPDAIKENETKILWNDNGALCISSQEMKHLMKSSLEFIVNKLEHLLQKHKQFQTLVLTGGFAKNNFLNESLKSQFPQLSLVMPKEFSNGVLQGATLSLMPKITSKLVIKSPFSIGVGVMTPFDADLHPDEKKILKDGKAWCADAWDTLVRIGQDMEVNAVINKRSYVGAQPGQRCLVLPIFKSSLTFVPKLVTDKAVRKCCELRFDSTKTWQEIDLFIICRASALIVMAIDRDLIIHREVLDFI